MIFNVLTYFVKKQRNKTKQKNPMFMGEAINLCGV